MSPGTSADATRIWIWIWPRIRIPNRIWIQMHLRVAQCVACRPVTQCKTGLHYRINKAVIGTLRERSAILVQKENLNIFFS